MEIVCKLRTLSVCMMLGLLAACGGGEDSLVGSGGTGGHAGTGGGGGTGGAPGCTSNDDCGGETPLCAPDGSCVLCLGHSDCPLDMPSCFEGACMLCGDDTACEGRGRCDPASGGCVECAEDAHCNGGRCTKAQRCVECLTNADCESGICNANVCAKGNACNDQVRCEPGFACVNWTTGALFGTCEKVCEVEAQTGCEDGRHCQLVTFDSATFEPIGLCMEPNGGPQEGQACGEDPSCEANLICVNYGTDDECVRYCQPDDPDACGEGRMCDAVRFSNVPGTPAIHVCVIQRDPCDKDSDCAAGEVCSLVGGPNGATELGCVPKAGAKAGGAACATSAECASGWCIAEFGLCYGACATGSDCATGADCASISVSSDGGPSTTVPACMRACESDRDCRATEGCSPGFTFGMKEWATFCLPSTGAASAGEACTTYADCRSGSCRMGLHGGFCDGPCRDDECGQNLECTPVWWHASGADGTYYTADDSYRPISMCRGLPCGADSDCPDDWACIPESDGNDPLVGEVVQRCMPGWGSRRGGEPCNWSTDGSGCRSDSCGVVRDQYLCFEACTAAADCTDGMICEPEAMEFYHGYTGTEFLYERFAACVPPPEGG